MTQELHFLTKKLYLCAEFVINKTERVMNNADFWASVRAIIAEGGEATVYDHGATLVKSIGLDYFILPILALDRIALHNAYFPETLLTVLGFGRGRRNLTTDVVFMLFTN